MWEDVLCSLGTAILRSCPHSICSSATTTMSYMGTWPRCNLLILYAHEVLMRDKWANPEEIAGFRIFAFVTRYEHHSKNLLACFTSSPL
jgi:hypothetical protein